MYYKPVTVAVSHHIRRIGIASTNQFLPGRADSPALQLIVTRLDLQYHDPAPYFEATQAIHTNRLAPNTH